MTAPSSISESSADASTLIDRFSREREVRDDSARAGLRYAIYAILIAISVGQMVGRIFAVNSVDLVSIEKHLKAQGRKDWQKQRPFLSGNDRSRWATVRALVDEGTFAIDKVQTLPNWDTIDMVKHDGRLFSSKPPLQSIVMAGEYWLLQRTLGWTLAEHPYEVGRTILVLNQVLPLLLYFLVLVKIAERYGETDFAKVFVVACGCLGTLLPTFAIVINNHLPAAVATAIALYAAMRIALDGAREPRYFVAAGFFAAGSVVGELPALAFFAALGLILLAIDWKSTLKYGVAPAVTLLAVYAGTYFVAHGRLAIPYAMRGQENWYDYDYERGGRILPSYWRHENLKGVDRGEPSRAVYAFHAIVGHHGVLSLTPIWIPAWIGMAYLAFRRREKLWLVGALSLTLTVVLLAFYLSRGQIDRNYGGVNCGMRWLLWLAPLWLTCLLPAASWASRSFGRQVLFCVLLGGSSLSASYPTWNPWTQPWIFNWLDHLGVIDYDTPVPIPEKEKLPTRAGNEPTAAAASAATSAATPATTPATP